MIEIEERSLLSEGEYGRLVATLSLAGTPVLSRRLCLIQQHNASFEPDPDQECNMILRIIDGRAFFVTKVGLWSKSQSRKEYSVEVMRGDFPILVDALSAAGHPYWIVSCALRKVFSTSELEVSVEHQVLTGAYLVEVEARTEEEAAARDSIKEFFGQHSLRRLDEKEFLEFLRHQNSFSATHLDLRNRSFAEAVSTLDIPRDFF